MHYFLYYIIQDIARLGKNSSFIDSFVSVLSYNLPGRVCSLLHRRRLSYNTLKSPKSLTVTHCIYDERKQTR